MSFWDNNKDSIKSGSWAVLKGAGKATSAVSKAGYSAYKNHNNQKKDAKLQDGEEAELEGTQSYGGQINYRDPKSYPPPPHHVDAYGPGNANPGVPVYQQAQQYPAYGQQQQQQPAVTPYGQQPPATPAYGQQPQAQAPTYGQPQPAATPYNQPEAVAPYSQQQPVATPYGQQPQAVPAYLQQPPAANPYGQQQSPAALPYGQQPLETPAYRQQPPAAPAYGQPQAATSYAQQPPATPYGQTTPAYGEQSTAANPYERVASQLPAANPYGQQAVSSPPALSQQQYGQPTPSLPQQQPYGQPSYPQQTSGTETPPDVLSYQNPYHSAIPEPTQPQYGQQHPPAASVNIAPSPASSRFPEPPKRTVPPGQQAANAYLQQPGHGTVPPPPAPVQPQYEQTPPPSATPERPTPSATPERPTPSPYVSQSYPQPPSRTVSSGPLPPQRTNTSTNTKERALPGRPDDEPAAEPQFKTNLMDFDLKKFGAPPPRARLTKDEEIKIEKRKADAQRIKAIKETSLQKAKESAAKYTSPYNSGIPLAPSSNNGSASPSVNPSTDRLTEVSYDSEEASQISEEAEKPKPFHLPDISQFQPPPMAPERRTPFQSESSTPSFVQQPAFQRPAYQVPEPVEPVYQEPIQHETVPQSHLGKHKPPKPVKYFHQEEQQPVFTEPQQPQYQHQPSISSTSSYSRPAMVTPPSSFEGIVKKTPPPKPAKLTDASSKPKKVPPPKPAKPAKPSALASASSHHEVVEDADVESSAKGNHIRELQARLGNLNFQ